MSRDTVLSRIRQALAGQTPSALLDVKPVVRASDTDAPLTWRDYDVALKEAHGEFLGPVPLTELAQRIQSVTGSECHYARGAAELLGKPVLDLPTAELDGLPWVVASGFLAIASTGSIAVSEAEVPNRLHVLLPENLLLLVPADALVDDLPDLYERLETQTLPGGYMTLISGPSKTADIELELVTGAHGPRSLTVIAYQTPKPAS